MYLSWQTTAEISTVTVYLQYLCSLEKGDKQHSIGLQVKLAQNKMRACKNKDRTKQDEGSVRTKVGQKQDNFSVTFKRKHERV